MIYLNVNKSIRINITKNHKMFKICKKYTSYSKDLYNKGNNIVTEEFITNGMFISYSKLWSMMKKDESFKIIGSNSGQHTLKILERNWKSYFVAIKDWSKYPYKYYGKPNLPRNLQERDSLVCVLTNMQTQIKDGYLYFAFKPFKAFNETIKVNFKGKHLQTRIVPKKGYFILEIVYETTVPEYQEFKNRIFGIDLGLNNLMTVQNNLGIKPFVINGKHLKSINSYYNMKKDILYENLRPFTNGGWSNKMSQLNMKRNNKIEYHLHNYSRYMVNCCLAYDIDTVVIGKNPKWKQGFRRQTNFVQIPFEKLIHMLEYKLREVGIRVILTEENYTSKASFLDGDEMKKGVTFSGKRIKRGLYRSKDGTLINADINGASNIIRKVFPNAFDDIKDVGLHPVIITV